MFRKKPASESTSLELSAEQLKGLLHSIEDHLKGRSKSGVPSSANLKLKSLHALHAELDMLAHVVKKDGERREAVTKALLIPFLDLSLDETKAKLMGTAKGKTLQFIEASWLKFLLPGISPKDPNKRILEELAFDPDNRELAVRHLFERMKASGFGETNPRLCAQVVSMVISMGVAAVSQWNNNLTREAGLTPDEQEKLMIGKERDYQRSVEHYVALNKNENFREKISRLASLDILLHLLTKEAYKIKGALSGGLSDDEKRNYLLAESVQFDGVVKKLNELHQKRETKETSADMYKAVLLTYFNAYVYDRYKGSLGGTVKGEFLLHLEDCLKQFHKKTGSALFVGEDNKTREASILSSVSSVAIESALRTDLINQVLIKALKEGFEKTLIGAESPERLESRRKIFVNVLKAVVRMGDEAVDAWNERVARLAPEVKEEESMLPFPDLVLSSLNYSEEEVNKTFALLNANPDFLRFVQEERFMDQRSQKDQRQISEFMQRFQ